MICVRSTNTSVPFHVLLRLRVREGNLQRIPARRNSSWGGTRADCAQQAGGSERPVQGASLHPSNLVASCELTKIFVMPETERPRRILVKVKSCARLSGSH